MRLGDLVVRFVADMGQWNTGVKQAQGDIDKTAKSTNTLGKETQATSRDMLILASTAAAAGYAVYAAAQKYGSAAQNLKDLSYQTGASTDALQKLQYGAMLSGADFGKVSFALNNVALSMEAATDATSAQARAFKTLGIDPSGKTPTQVFDELTVALTNTKDASKRGALANDTLGKSWKEILPFMAEYIANKEKINKFEGYTKEELRNQESLKVAFDESVGSLDRFFGHWVARLGEVAAAQEKLEDSQPSYLDQWLNNTFGDKSSAKSGAGGRKGGDAPAPTIKSPNGGLFAEIQKRIAALKEDYGWLVKANDAEKERLAIAKDLNAVKRAEKDLTGDYLSDVQNAGDDVAGIRRLTMGYQRNLKKLKGQESELSGDMQNAAFKTIAAQREDAGAYSSFSMNIQNVNLSKDYPLSAFMKDYEAQMKTKAKQAGVRTAS